MASDGSTPLLVEAKFWAGLTGHQPVSYWQRLPVEQPAMLLFLVPRYASRCSGPRFWLGRRRQGSQPLTSGAAGSTAMPALAPRSTCWP
jgi:hypothetical protein